MNGEEYDWKLLSMVSDNQTKRMIKKVTDKENWLRKKALDDEFFENSLRGKI